MRINAPFVATLLLATLPVAAQELREGDTPFAAEALRTELSGQVLEFFDGSLARYETDAAYSYRYRPDDPPFRGTWETTADSAVCVTFDNGFLRCDTIVRDGSSAGPGRGGRLVLITEDGLRFPVRAMHEIGS